MFKKVEPLQLRQSDAGDWEVENVANHWIKCETKEDAELISNAPIVRAKLDRTTRPDYVLAAELDKTGEMLDKYNMGSESRYFRAMAKLARGQDS